MIHASENETSFRKHVRARFGEVKYSSNINYISYSNFTLIHVMKPRPIVMEILARK